MLVKTSIHDNIIHRSRSIDILDDDDEPEVVIHLTASNPQAIKKYVKFDITRREYFQVNVGLQAAGFIDHLDIKSTIVHKDSPEVNIGIIPKEGNIDEHYRAKNRFFTMRKSNRRKLNLKEFQLTNFFLWKEEPSPRVAWEEALKLKLRDPQEEFSLAQLTSIYVEF